MTDAPDGRDGPRKKPVSEERPSGSATLFGAILIVALTLFGIWLLNGIDNSKKAQECLESGRRNCRIIETAR